MPEPGRYAIMSRGRARWFVTVEVADGFKITDIDRGDGSPGSSSITVAPPVDCVAAQPAPALVGKVTLAPVVLDVAPVVAGRPLKVNAVMARFLAAAEAEATSEPKAEPMTRARWKRMSMDARAHHIQHFTECATEEERLEWEETLPA